MDHLLSRLRGLLRSPGRGEARASWKATAAPACFYYPGDSTHEHGDQREGLVSEMSMTVVAAERSHRGHIRKVNEDAVTVAAPIFAVADGMGGHRSGDVASQIVATVLGGLGREGPHDEDGIRGALELANLRIRQETPQDDDASSAGTTVVGVMLAEHDSLAFNVGDSRLYMFRRGAMRQLSKDHSVVQELVDMGEIEAVDAPRHQQRNVITRAIGLESVVDIDFWELEPESGDRYLLASDGLSGELSDDEIAAVLAEHHGPNAAADALVESALAKGGRDNVTVIVIDVHEYAGATVVEDPVSGGFVNPSSGDTTERRRKREEAAKTRQGE